VETISKNIGIAEFAPFLEKINLLVVELGKKTKIERVFFLLTPILAKLKEDGELAPLQQEAMKQICKIISEIDSVVHAVTEDFVYNNMTGAFTSRYSCFCIHLSLLPLAEMTTLLSTRASGFTLT
jgi:hypothetical protein